MGLILFGFCLSVPDIQIFIIQKDFLGEIPINPEVGRNGDEGKPIVEANQEHEISKIYLEFANKIKSIYL